MLSFRVLLVTSHHLPTDSPSSFVGFLLLRSTCMLDPVAPVTKPISGKNEACRSETCDSSAWNACLTLQEAQLRKLTFSQSTPCRYIGGVQILRILNFYLRGWGGAPAALLPGMDPGTYWTGGWVVPIAGLDVLEMREIYCRGGMFDNRDCLLPFVTESLFPFAFHKYKHQNIQNYNFSCWNLVSHIEGRA